MYQSVGANHVFVVSGFEVAGTAAIAHVVAVDAHLLSLAATAGNLLGAVFVNVLERMDKHSHASLEHR